MEIIERHHDKKLDAPSGTAVITAQKIAEVRQAMHQGNPDEKELLAGARGADYEGMKIHSVRLPGYVASQEDYFWQSGRDFAHQQRAGEPRVLYARCDAWLPQAAGYGWFDLRLG